MSILYKETCNITIQSVVPGLNMLAHFEETTSHKVGWLNVDTNIFDETPIFVLARTRNACLPETN